MKKLLYQRHATLFQRGTPTLKQHCQRLKIRRRIIFHFQHQINVISTLLYKAEATMIRDTHILNSSPAYQSFFLPYQTYYRVMNGEHCVFAIQIEILETAFQHCSHTYSIGKDMPLTFCLMWVSLFLFLWLFFPLKFSC